MKAAGLMPAAHLFTHDAMNTTFSLRIREVDEAFARSMARECCNQLDLLESHMSRFIEGSEVAQINAMRAGETLYLSDACHQCLLLALNARTHTGGLFDITLGSRIAHRKSGDSGPEPPLAGRLALHPDVPAITCETPAARSISAASPRDLPSTNSNNSSPRGVPMTHSSPPVPARGSRSARAHGPSI